MPSRKSTERIKAEQIYRESSGSIKLIEIAEQLGVPPSKVRKWKSLDKWDELSKKKQVERSTKNKGSVPSKKKARSAAKETDDLIAEAIEDNDKLTQQQKDFCLYFMRNRNATQAYLKSHNCSYGTANTEGPAALVNPRIKEELKRLRKIKNAALGDLCGEDIIELHMRIAFADITDFVEFRSKRVPVVYDGELQYAKDPKSKKEVMLSYVENEVCIIDSKNVDGVLLTEVSKGKDGVKVKLADKQRSLQFLERYFELNPNDRHRKEYDRQRLDLELVKLETLNQVSRDEPDGSTSNFLSALMAVTEEAWKGYGETIDEETKE